MPTTETQKQFIQTQKRSRKRITLARLALFILFLLAWETAAGTGQIDPFIFSSPSRVFRTFLTMWQEEQLALQIGITLAETLISFFLVVFLSLSLAVLLWLCPGFARVLEPYLVVLNSRQSQPWPPFLSSGWEQI